MLLRRPRQRTVGGFVKCVRETISDGKFGARAPLSRSHRPDLFRQPASRNRGDRVRFLLAPVPVDLTDDALAAALADLDLRCLPLPEAPGAGEWRRPFPQDHISLHVVVSGDCLIDTPVPLWRHRLRTGEVLVVNRGVEGELRATGGDRRLPEVLSMRVQLDGQPGHPLVHSLPKIIRANPTGVPKSFGPALDTVVGELSIPLVGQTSVLARMGEVLFIQALRMHLGDLAWNDSGWFRALADPVLREHLHLAPDPAVSVSVLARAAHRSPRRLRARFLRAAGARSAAFLRDARIRRAATLLRDGEHDLAKIAALTGYGSRQALARAFRRRFGVSPTEYWRQAQSRPFPRAQAGASPRSPPGRRDPAEPE